MLFCAVVENWTCTEVCAVLLTGSGRIGKCKCSHVKCFNRRLLNSSRVIEKRGVVTCTLAVGPRQLEIP